MLLNSEFNGKLEKLIYSQMWSSSSTEVQHEIIATCGLRFSFLSLPHTHTHTHTQVHIYKVGGVTSHYLSWILMITDCFVQKAPGGSKLITHQWMVPKHVLVNVCTCVVVHVFSYSYVYCNYFRPHNQPTTSLWFVNLHVCIVCSKVCSPGACVHTVGILCAYEPSYVYFVLMTVAKMLEEWKKSTVRSLSWVRPTEGRLLACW